MAEYGELIDDEIKPFQNDIYKLFIKYFNNPTLVKIKDNNEHSMYGCKLYCLLNRDCRYIIIFTEKDDNIIKSTYKLDQLHWVSFQIRTLPNEYENIETVHGYEPVFEGPLTAKIKRTEVKKEASTYICEKIPIIVTMLHTQKNTADSYTKEGTIIHALETFETVITFA